MVDNTITIVVSTSSTLIQGHLLYLKSLCNVPKRLSTHRKPFSELETLSSKYTHFTPIVNIEKEHR